MTTLGVVFGLYVESVLQAFLFTETIAAFMGISLFGAISWERANRWGAFASLAVSSLTFFWLSWKDFGSFLQWEAMNFGIALVAGFAVLVIVSLVTPRESASRTEPFYARLNRQTRFDEASGKELEVHEDGHDLLFVHLFDLRLSDGLGAFYRRFRVDINGLALAFGVVAALIALAKGILYLP